MGRLQHSFFLVHTKQQMWSRELDANKQKKSYVDALE